MGRDPDSTNAKYKSYFDRDYHRDHPVIYNNP